MAKVLRPDQAGAEKALRDLGLEAEALAASTPTTPAPTGNSTRGTTDDNDTRTGGQDDGTGQTQTRTGS